MLVSWNSTNQCNMFCAHCYRESGNIAKNELNTVEAKKMLREMKKAGFQIMIFSGGEPLMRTDIYELGAYAKEIGLRPVLGTNGTLITKEVARKIKEAGFMAAGVSLDTLSEEKYNDFRKFPNAFEKTVSGMNNLREAGVPFQIHTTVMKWNVNELDKMTDFAVEIGARAHHIFFLVPTGRGVEIETQALEIKEYEKVITDIVKKQVLCPIEVKPTCAPQFVRIAKQQNIDIRFKRGCLAGLSYCIVSPIGDVQPCAYLNIPLGNVRDTPFDEIWKNNPVLKKLRTADYSGKCGICAYKNTCGGCRARAYFYEGDYMAEDKHCMYNPKTDKVENE